MDTLLHIAAAAVGAGAVVGVARRIWRTRDTTRRLAERETYRRRRAAERVEREDASVGALVDRFFPFAKAAWVAESGQTDARERLRNALDTIDGIVLGSADIGFNAVLPDSIRRQHLICLGKSGYGKTTLAIRMIRDDLRRGRGIFILGAEAELFRDRVLGMVPAERTKDVLLFRPADPGCTLSWNPLSLEDGEDQALAAGELFGIFKRAVGETTIGARADAILSAAFGLLVGRRHATLWSVIRLLEDDAYRAAVVAECEDPYLKEFWTRTFPEYPAGAALPLANRFHQFLRLPQLRAALCHPISSFSLRAALANSQIVLFDLSGLDPDATRLVGQLLLSKFQVELMRRERVPEEQRPPVHVHVDEFHMFADSAEGTWRELLARGRRFGLGLHLYTQHPNQLPRSLQQEIFGNVSSVLALNLSAGDAASVRREILVPGADGAPKPVSGEAFIALPVGTGYARLGGACALRVRFAPPIDRPDAAAGDRVRQVSWKKYAAPPMPKEDSVSPAASPAPTAVAPVGGKPAPATPGRGGAQHKMLQQLAKEWGEERGFRASLEEDVLGGAGRVDVVLARDDVRIAVEVSVSSSPAEVASTAGKCVAAGFTHVVIVAAEADALRRAEQPTLDVIPAKDRNRVRFLTPDGLRSFLDGLSTTVQVQDLTAGYVVRVEARAAGRMPHRHALAQLVGNALLRRRPSS